MLTRLRALGRREVEPPPLLLLQRQHPASQPAVTHVVERSQPRCYGEYHRLRMGQRAHDLHAADRYRRRCCATVGACCLLGRRCRHLVDRALELSEGRGSKSRTWKIRPQHRKQNRPDERRP